MNEAKIADAQVKLMALKRQIRTARGPFQKFLNLIRKWTVTSLEEKIEAWKREESDSYARPALEASLANLQKALSSYTAPDKTLRDTLEESQQAIEKQLKSLKKRQQRLLGNQEALWGMLASKHPELFEASNDVPVAFEGSDELAQLREKISIATEYAKIFQNYDPDVAKEIHEQINTWQIEQQTLMGTVTAELEVKSPRPPSPEAKLSNRLSNAIHTIEDYSREKEKTITDLTELTDQDKQKSTGPTSATDYRSPVQRRIDYLNVEIRDIQQALSRKGEKISAQDRKGHEIWIQEHRQERDALQRGMQGVRFEEPEETKEAGIVIPAEEKLVADMERRRKEIQESVQKSLDQPQTPETEKAMQTLLEEMEKIEALLSAKKQSPKP